MNDMAIRSGCVLMILMLLQFEGTAFQVTHQMPLSFGAPDASTLSQPTPNRMMVEPTSKNEPITSLPLRNSTFNRAPEHEGLSAYRLLSPNSPQSGRKPNPEVQVRAGTNGSILTLDDVLTRVETYHPKLRGAKTERDLAAAKILEKQGAFDPVLGLGTDYLQYNSTSRRGSSLTTRTNDVEIEYLTRSGVKVYFGSRFNFGTVKSPLSSTGSTGEYYLGVKVPLMRNFRINEKSAAERQALLGEPLADEQVKLMQLNLQLNAAVSYWEWVAAKQKLDVAVNLLNLSRIRTEAVNARVRAGDLPPIDTIEAEQEVQRRLGGVTKAERDLQKTAFKLSLYLWEANDQPLPPPSAAQIPYRFPVPTLYPNERVVEAQRLALERRPELKLLAINQDISQIDLALGRNQRRPAIDVGFSPGRDTGFGGIGNTWKADLTISLPLRQRTADGKIQAAQAKLQKLDLELLNQRQAILVEVNDAFNAINTTYERYLASEREVQLARQLENGERTRFNLGDSTLFLVNQRERATAEAETKLIEIRVEYEQAVATFRAASGTFR